MAKKKQSDEVTLVTVTVKDSITKGEIESAFLGSYSMPLVESEDQDGVKTSSPMFDNGEDFVEYHVKNYIRNVVREYKERIAVSAAKESAQTDVFE